MLARRKLNSIESTISKTLVDNEMSHEDFTKIINEENSYRELKQREIQRSNIERNKQI